MDFNKLYCYTIFDPQCNGVVINMVALGTDEVLSIHKGYWDTICFALMIAVPFKFVGMALAFEYILRFEYRKDKIRGGMKHLVSWYGLEMLFNKINHLPYAMQGIMRLDSKMCFAIEMENEVLWHERKDRHREYERPSD